MWNSSKGKIMIQMIIGHLNLNGMLEKRGENKVSFVWYFLQCLSNINCGWTSKDFFGDNMQVFNPQFLFHYSHNQQWFSINKVICINTFNISIPGEITDTIGKWEWLNILIWNIIYKSKMISFHQHHPLPSTQEDVCFKQVMLWDTDAF